MEGLKHILLTLRQIIKAHEEADFDHLDFLVAHAKQELGEFEEKHNLKGTYEDMLSGGPSRQSPHRVARV